MWTFLGCPRRSTGLPHQSYPFTTRAMRSRSMSHCPARSSPTWRRMVSSVCCCAVDRAAKSESCLTLVRSIAARRADGGRAWKTSAPTGTLATQGGQGRAGGGVADRDRGGIQTKTLRGETRFCRNGRLPPVEDMRSRAGAPFPLDNRCRDWTCRRRGAQKALFRLTSDLNRVPRLRGSVPECSGCGAGARRRRAR